MGQPTLTSCSRLTWFIHGTSVNVLKDLSASNLSAQTKYRIACIKNERRALAYIQGFYKMNYRQCMVHPAGIIGL